MNLLDIADVLIYLKYLLSEEEELLDVAGYLKETDEIKKHDLKKVSFGGAAE